MTEFKRVGIVFHGLSDRAIQFSLELENFVGQKFGASTWRLAAAEDSQIRRMAVDSGLILGIGGDGTLLRAARAISETGVPIVGINLGKLGFMSEFNAGEAFGMLPRIFQGEGWLDTRTMISASIATRSTAITALNDLLIARGNSSRIVRVSAAVDGQPLTSFRADGVVVSTATGSTGYALSAGGPIMHPQSQDILLSPICPHLSFSRCLVLPKDAEVELQVTTDRQALCSADGQVEFPIESGTSIVIRRSAEVTRFLRLRSPAFFWSSLTQRLKGDNVC